MALKNFRRKIGACCQSVIDPAVPTFTTNENPVRNYRLASVSDAATN